MLTLAGVQFFPVTPFNSSGGIDTGLLAEHLESRLEFEPGAIFAACGTGEFHALSPSEHQQVTAVAMDVARGRCPVFVGVGGPLGSATQMAVHAADLGASGLLLLPPYLAATTQPGLVAYGRAVLAASELPVIIYNRREFQLDPESAVALASNPRVLGFKDGLGDIDLLTSIQVEINRAFSADRSIQYFNGMPTAETSARAYRSIGVETYSSAVFGFVPQISRAFYNALVSGDRDLTDRLLSEFFVPFARLRTSVPGGAISVVKLGVSLTGQRVGGVRPPLVDPPPSIADALRDIIAAGLACVPIAAST